MSIDAEDHWAHKCGIAYNRIEELERQLAECEQVGQAMSKAALEKYGRHAPCCQTRPWIGNNDKCNCGFEEALAGAGEQEDTDG